MIMTPDKKPMRSVTEYIKSPHQQAAAKLDQTPQQAAAKNYFRKAEAQGIIDKFRPRIERALEEEFEDWTVTEYQGDLVRKAIVKVRVGEADFVHIYGTRLARSEPWVCRFAPYKRMSDQLEWGQDNYDTLPERGLCGDQLNLNGCATNGCVSM